MTPARFAVLLAFVIPLAGWSLHLGKQIWLARQLAPYRAEIEFHLGDIISISFPRGSQGFGDSQTSLLAMFSTVRTLDLADTAVTDAGLHVVDQLPNLERLLVRGNQIAPERERMLSRRMVVEKEYVVDGFKVQADYAR